MTQDYHQQMPEQENYPATDQGHGNHLVPQQYIIAANPTDFLQWGFMLLFVAVLFGCIDDFIDPPELDEGESLQNWLDDLENYEDVMGVFNTLSAVSAQIGFLLIAMTLMKRGFDQNAVYSDSLRMAMIIASALILMQVAFPQTSAPSLLEALAQGLADPY